MGTKKFCDRCGDIVPGKRLDNWWYGKEIRSKSMMYYGEWHVQYRFELCKECADFMNTVCKDALRKGNCDDNSGT